MPRTLGPHQISLPKMAARTWYRNCVILARSFVRSRRGIPRWVSGTYTAQHRQQHRQSPFRRSANQSTGRQTEPPQPPSIYTSIPNILKAPQQPPTPLPWFHSLVRPIQMASSTMMIPSTYLFSATSRRAVCQRPVAKGPRKPPTT